jgi:3-methylcrotonyl-CoA carboxylase alpha subunit
MAQLAIPDVSRLRTEAVMIAGRSPLRLRIAGQLHDVAEQPSASGAFCIVIDGHTHAGWRYRAGNVVHVRLAGRTFTVSLPDPSAATAFASASGRELRAPLPGTVVAIGTQPGAVVRRGDTLLTIESMKVQMALPAPGDGVVETVHVVANAVFERDALLVVLQPET